MATEVGLAFRGGHEANILKAIRQTTRGAGVATNGDVAKTLTVGDAQFQIWNSPLTVARAVTLSTTGAQNGDWFRITRTAAATGAFALNVGTGPLKALATAGNWCEVTFNGTAWVLTANGAL